MILPFVVFNPGDLYYLGYKIIIIIITGAGESENILSVVSRYDGVSLWVISEVNGGAPVNGGSAGGVGGANSKHGIQ